MNEVETAWVAGLLEGERCFAIKVRSINISCSMTDCDVIKKLYDVAGGRFNGPYLPEGKKPVWTWALNQRAEVVSLIGALRPHMGERRRTKIDAMLDWNEEYPIGRPRKDAAQHGSIGMYSNHGCRCAECVTVWRTYQRNRYAANPEQFRNYQRNYYWAVERGRMTGEGDDT